MSALSDRYLERHHLIIEKKAQIEEVQKQLDREVQQAISDLQTGLEAAENQVKALTAGVQ